MLEHVEKELAEIEETINVGSEAAVSVEDTINPGVTVRIDNKEMKISNTMQHVKFYRLTDMTDIMIEMLRREKENKEL